MKITLSLLEVERLIRDCYTLPEETEIVIANHEETKDLAEVYCKLLRYREECRRVPAVKAIREFNGCGPNYAINFVNTFFGLDGKMNGPILSDPCNSLTGFTEMYKEHFGALYEDN